MFYPKLGQCVNTQDLEPQENKYWVLKLAKINISHPDEIDVQNRN